MRNAMPFALIRYRNGRQVGQLRIPDLAVLSDYIGRALEHSAELPPGVSATQVIDARHKAITEVNAGNPVFIAVNTQSGVMGECFIRMDLQRGAA